MSQLNVRVPDELRARLRSAAAQHGVSQSHLIRAALDQALASDARAPDSLEDQTRLLGTGALLSPRARFDQWLADRTGMARALTEARSLTDEVKRDAQALWEKLLALYEGGAHAALG